MVNEFSYPGEVVVRTQGGLLRILCLNSVRTSEVRFSTRVSVQVEIPMSGSNASTAENRKLDTNSTEATREEWDSRTVEAQLWPDTNNLTGPLLGAPPGWLQLDHG